MNIRPVRLLLIITALLILPGILALALVLATPNLDITDWRLLLHAATGRGGPSADAATVNERLHVPDGWRITLYADGLPQARFLRPLPDGELLLSRPRLGQITLLSRDTDGDGHPDHVSVLLDGLDQPHGIEVADGWLYVAEGSAIGRVAFDTASGRLAGTYHRIFNELPAGGNHWSRSVRMGPDGWLYVSIGSSCNACEEEHPWRAAMLRMRPDGSEVQLHATGLRNSVGFDWTPWSGELYATDNGRDMLGDDVPPCELNHIVAGGFYGWPYVHGNGTPDPGLGTAHPEKVASAIGPAHEFGAHTAPLGITFVRDSANIARLGRAALAALHGSWNRSTPAGYAVVLLQWQDDGSIVETPFLTGFERAREVIGRPVDVAEAADGTLYVSDDYAGAIYRISRR